ncbi:hypothetical protein [Chryseolinea lacunae]|uniref:Outer membrane protein beta-barrel domain-containing protein n=1 Tax=Chryseolinea lacunae TaxID=2801331 RepID=A0ABS1KUB2_9BACT|nr:hypothetical protein [Chryseolinea lacunae]MBL0743021.1 hypothetical protein [Chryseolinea lacunae]
MKKLNAVHGAFIFLTILLPALVSQNVCAQMDSTQRPQPNRCNLAVGAGQFGDDWGISAELTTPTFWNKALALRFKGSTYWLECYKARQDHWAPYRMVSVSLVYKFRITADAGTYVAYVEAGPFTILPDERYSTQKHVEGFSAAVGAELFFRQCPRVPVCYFLALGASACKASADTLDGEPRYGEGLTFVNGFRFYF